MMDTREKAAEGTERMDVAHIGIAGALLAGLLSFLSPCVLPLTPAYVARLAGPAVWRSSSLKPAERHALRLTTTLHAAVFVAGFSVTFIALGATASELGQLLYDQQQLGGGAAGRVERVRWYRSLLATELRVVG